MVLDVQDLTVTYETRDGRVRAVDDVSFTIEDGVNYGLSGESGSGKSTVADAILGLLPDTATVESGSVEFRGRDLLDCSDEEVRDVRWERIAYVPQSAMDALDPVMTAGAQIRQAIRTNRNISESSAQTRALELFEVVGLDADRIDDYPHEFSAGMRQRVVIAMALALEPDLIIADEPTTGLDAIVQDEIMDQILDVQERLDSSLLLITHDVGTVAESCDKFSVLYGGRVMEQGSVDNVLLNPAHPYTMGLKNSVPGVSDDDDPVAIPGTPPEPGERPSACAFVDRCPFATEECETSSPDLVELPARDQRSACHHVKRAGRMRRAAMDPETWGIEPNETSCGTGEPLLETVGLTKRYEQSQSLIRKLLGSDSTVVRAAEDVSLTVSRSEILGLAGETGSGKSTLAETMALLEEPSDGEIVLDGKSHEYYRDGNMMEFRRKVQIVFQNPFDALNPRMTVGQIVGEPLSIHGVDVEDREAAIVDALERVDLAPGAAYLDKYPHELSGGQRQRVSIARSLVLEPELLICDEPASLLDVSLKVNLLNLLRELAVERDLGVLYISHDLASLTQIADRLAIMHRGEVVERGPTAEIMEQPKHPYTETLLSAAPETDPTADRERVRLEGSSPDSAAVHGGCSFVDRCPRAGEKCWQTDPDLGGAGDRAVACHYPLDGPGPDRGDSPPGDVDGEAAADGEGSAVERASSATSTPFRTNENRTD